MGGVVKVRLHDGSGFRDYKYVIADLDRHGRVRHYFRRKGQRKTVLREKPGSAEFDAEYSRAFESIPQFPETTQSGQAVPGTMRWLCQQYYASAAFKSLGDSTRKVRRGILDTLCERIGAFRYALMEPQHVAKLQEEKADLPEAANARVKALRQLFTWAARPPYLYVKLNPANEVAYLPSNNPDGFRAWTEDDVLKYEARHPTGTKARLALDLMLFTGVRRGDVVRLGPQMERVSIEKLPDGTTIVVDKLVFTETKGGARTIKPHQIPIIPALRASIDATRAGHLVYLATEFDRPFTVRGFGNWFKRRCREAGVAPDLSAHGLRKLGAQRAAENGATESQLMALFGWTTGKQAAHYTRKANRIRLEAEAAPKLQPKDNVTKLKVLPEPSAQNPNYLYVISGKNRPVKIGIAGDPYRRLGDLQVGSPQKLYLRRLFLCLSRVDVEKVEESTHRALIPHKVHGEWFDITAAEAIKTVEATASALEIVMATVAFAGRHVDAAEWTENKRKQSSRSNPDGV